MFERFTDRARRVTVLAQEEARCLNHDYIGTEHILLGLLHEGDGIAAKALQALGISLEAARSEIETIIGHGQQAPPGHIPFTPRAKTVLELSLREALQLGHNYIGTEHILLGLIREGEGVAAQVLVKLGAELTRVRQQVIQLVTGGDIVSEGVNIKTIEAQIAELMLEAQIIRARKEKEQALDAEDFEGANRARDREKELVAKRQSVSVPQTKISDLTIGGGLNLKRAGLGKHAAPSDKHFFQGADHVEARLTVDIPNQPKVSVDKNMFEKVKDGLAYVIEDPFSGELRLYPLNWTGRVITGVNWEGQLQ